MRHYVDPEGKFFRVGDLDIESEYCANTIILFKESLNNYRLIFNLSKNNDYVRLSSNEDDIKLSFKINDIDCSSSIRLYNYNDGCIIFDTSNDIFSSIADEHTKYTCTASLGVIDESLNMDLTFKIPMTVIPGSEDSLSDVSGPTSKVESYYITGGKHSKPVNPKFDELINYD